MNVPQLRFDGFNGEWSLGTIGDFITHMVGGASITPDDYISDGIPTIPKKAIVSGGILNLDGNQLYVSKEFQEKYSTSNINNEFLVTTLRDLVPSAPSMGYIVRVPKTDERSFVLSQGVYGFKVKNSMSEGYLIAFSNTQKYRRIIQFIKTGSTQVHIRNNEFLNIKISYPSLKEQEKVASFFELLDKKLTKQKEKIEKLEQFKKGMMQKIFSQELRFKGEDGGEFPEWEVQALNDFTRRVVRKNKGLLSTRPLTISAQQGLVDQKEFFNKNVASTNTEGYYLLKKGEFAYNKSYSNGYPWGAIKRLDNYEDGVLSTLYICFEPLTNVDSDFLSIYFESTFWYKEVSLISGEGARNHGLLNIGVNDFFETKHKLPSIEEQRKIASALMQLNKKIEKEKEKLMILEEQKKGFMQRMLI